MKRGSTAVASGQATFTQALILAEFDGDPAAITELTEWIEEGYDDDELTHVAARLRRDRERAAAVAALTAELTAAGKRVVTDEDDYEVLSRFTNAGDDVTDYDERTPITEDEHADCSGAAFEVMQYGDVVARPVCTTPAVHTIRVRAYVPTGTPAQVEPASDEDAAAEAEARTAERRELIANNKTFHVANVSTSAQVTG